MAERRIQLTSPLTGATTREGGTAEITEIVLREPKYPDIMLLGEPSAFGRSEGGIMYTSEKDDVLDMYVRRLMIEPKDTNLLSQVVLADALQLREAVFDFFRAARLVAFKGSSSGSSDGNT